MYHHGADHEGHDRVLRNTQREKKNKVRLSTGVVGRFWTCDALDGSFAELLTDAVVNNLRGDQSEKLRLQYRDLAHINPRIVCLHLSGNGRDNERKSWPGCDYLMQGETGLM